MSNWLSRVHISVQSLFAWVFRSVFHQFSYSKGLHVGHRSLPSWFWWMIVTHENGELLFPGYLHEISNLHIQLGGDISPSLWVPGSLRFLVSTSFLCQHENCHFSQLGKYFLRCGSGDFHFCSWLCRSSRGGKRNVFIYNVVPNFNWYLSCLET